EGEVGRPVVGGVVVAVPAPVEAFLFGAVHALPIAAGDEEHGGDAPAEEGPVIGVGSGLGGGGLPAVLGRDGGGDLSEGGVGAAGHAPGAGRGGGRAGVEVDDGDGALEGDERRRRVIRRPEQSALLAGEEEEEDGAGRGLVGERLGDGEEHGGAGRVVGEAVVDGVPV